MALVPSFCAFAECIGQETPARRQVRRVMAILGGAASDFVVWLGHCGLYVGMDLSFHTSSTHSCLLDAWFDFRRALRFGYPGVW